MIRLCPKTTYLTFICCRVEVSLLDCFGTFKRGPCYAVNNIGVTLHNTHYRVNITVAVCLFYKVKVPNYDVLVLSRRGEILGLHFVHGERRRADCYSFNPFLMALRQSLDTKARIYVPDAYRLVT